MGDYSVCRNSFLGTILPFPLKGGRVNVTALVIPVLLSAQPDRICYKQSDYSHLSLVWKEDEAGTPTTNEIKGGCGL